MINVTKSFLPPLEEYVKMLEEVWQSNILTNRGPMALKLEKELEARFGINHLLFVSNGTIAIQLAIQALGITGEIITTPFSYVATTSSALWENLEVVFVDIDAKTLCVDPKKIEAAITPKTTAILATHVFGNPCDVVAIEQIAKKHNLKVIYDAAHAFDVQYAGKSILEYGDASTLSFHATKVFSTGEGGGVAIKDTETFEKLKLLHSFGHIRDDHFICGINGKNSDIHAAFGLTNLIHVKDQIAKRKTVCELYDRLLESGKITKPTQQPNATRNYSYYPVIFESEAVLTKVKNALEKEEIFARRYFYPSLNKLPYVKDTPCPVSEKISNSILCLPLYGDLASNDVEKISNIILKAI
jgi:dTDP-4-amino-4,6-dideoxygalactose transaminase